MQKALALILLAMLCGCQDGTAEWAAAHSRETRTRHDNFQQEFYQKWELARDDINGFREQLRDCNREPTPADSHLAVSPEAGKLKHEVTIQMYALKPDGRPCVVVDKPTTISAADFAYMIECADVPPPPAELEHSVLVTPEGDCEAEETWKVKYVNEKPSYLRKQTKPPCEQ